MERDSIVSRANSIYTTQLTLRYCLIADNEMNAIKGVIIINLYLQIESIAKNKGVG
jgi:hypothetical protein